MADAFYIRAREAHGLNSMLLTLRRQEVEAREAELRPALARKVKAEGGGTEAERKAAVEALLSEDGPLAELRADVASRTIDVQRSAIVLDSADKGHKSARAQVIAQAVICEAEGAQRFGAVVQELGDGE